MTSQVAPPAQQPVPCRYCGTDLVTSTAKTCANCGEPQFKLGFLVNRLSIPDWALTGSVIALLFGNFTSCMRQDKAEIETTVVEARQNSILLAVYNNGKANSLVSGLQLIVPGSEPIHLTARETSADRPQPAFLVRHGGDAVLIDLQLDPGTRSILSTAPTDAQCSVAFKRIESGSRAPDQTATFGCRTLI